MLSLGMTLYTVEIPTMLGRVCVGRFQTLDQARAWARGRGAIIPIFSSTAGVDALLEAPSLEVLESLLDD